MAQTSVRAELVMIGTELLLGQTVDTNAAHIAEQLAANGINVYFKATVGDNWTRMTGVLAQHADAFRHRHHQRRAGTHRGRLDPRSRGLGAAPPLVEDEQALESIESWFRRSGRPMPSSNRKQALMPQGAHVITNGHGTAPGFIVEHDDKIVVCMPGVPHEMKAMLQNGVLPYLRRRYRLDATLYTRNLKFYGIGESALEERLRDLFRMTNPTVAPYAGMAEVKVRLTARAASPDEAESIVRPRGAGES